MTGCIVGNCTYGDMPIDETDWDDHILLNSNELVFVHVWCVKRYKQGKRRNDYINNLEQENTIMNDTVECPYCEHKNDMSEGTVELPSDNKFDHESEEFGEETREICKKDSIFPHPKHLKETSVCRSCWHKATCEEYLKS